MECAEENSKQSPHTPDPPGVISNEENLLRIIIAPEHQDLETGEIKTAAFKKDELKGEGLSFARMKLASEAELNLHASALASTRAENQFMGVLIGNVGAIRQIVDNGARAFCVLDDGLVDFPSHAIVKRSGNQGDGAIKRARAQLMKVFGTNLVSVADALGQK